MNFFSFLNRQRRFSRETFGESKRTEGILSHISKEVEEVRANPDDLSEWIDLIILACDGAMRRGFTPYQVCQALLAKLAKNIARQWPKNSRTAPEDEAVEHVRGGEQNS